MTVSFVVWPGALLKMKDNSMINYCRTIDINLNFSRQILQTVYSYSHTTVHKGSFNKLYTHIHTHRVHLNKLGFHYSIWSSSMLHQHMLHYAVEESRSQTSVTWRIIVLLLSQLYCMSFNGPLGLLLYFSFIITQVPRSWVEHPLARTFSIIVVEGKWYFIAGPNCDARNTSSLIHWSEVVTWLYLTTRVQEMQSYHVPGVWRTVNICLAALTASFFFLRHCPF